MNQKLAKSVRKEIKALFGDPLAEPREYNTLTNRKWWYQDTDGTKKFQLVQGTVVCAGARGLYQETKRKLKKGEINVEN